MMYFVFAWHVRFFRFHLDFKLLSVEIMSQSDIDLLKESIELLGSRLNERSLLPDCKVATQHRPALFLACEIIIHHALHCYQKE